MAFSHLINCVLLAYGPFFVCYRAKNLAEYGALKVVLFSAASYLVTAAVKVILIASFLSTVSYESQDFDISNEFNKNIFNFIEVVGLYFATQYRYTYLDSPVLRALAITIGWGLADSVCSNLFFFILNASGDEFSWKYTIRAACGNIEILEIFCIVSIILYISRNVRRTEVTMSSVNIIGFLFGFVKTVVFPTALSYLLHTGVISDEDYRFPLVKGIFALGLLVSYAYEKFLVTVAGPQLRNLGQRLNILGLTVQGPLASDDRQIVVPSLRSKAFESNTPQLNQSNFVAPNSVIIGQVSLGDKSSVWYGSTLRGDQSEINVGKNTILQDLVTLFPRKQAPINVGDNVYVGPNTVLESCTVENNAFIGMGASVRSGSKVESYGVVAAGAVVPENTTIPAYQIWAGNPATYLRDLTNEEKEVLEEFHSEIQSLARVHGEETEKPFRQIINDLDSQAEQEYLDPEELALLKMKELGFPVEAEDEDFIEQRVFYKDKETPEEQYWKKHYDPYEQDVFNFPDSFKIYGENYERYDELKKYFEENPSAEFKPVDMDLRQMPNDQSPWTRKF